MPPIARMKPRPLQGEDFAGHDRAVDVERDLAGRSRERLGTILTPC